jgi:hypothetical protein
MAFSTILSSTIQVGKALKKELFDLIKSNFDDLDSRVNNLEAGAAQVVVFDFDFRNAGSFNSNTGIFYYEATRDFTLTDSFIRIYEKGSLTGALEIDILKSVTDLDGPSFSSVFTTKPKITWASASDYDASTNQVFNPSQITINKGDFLRLDITEMPSGGILSKFILITYGE